MIGCHVPQDKNGYGRISKSEWGQSIAANRVLLQKYFGSELKGSGREGDLDSPPTSSLELHDLKEIGKAFKRLDADGSGDLTWEEVRKAGQTNELSEHLPALLFVQPV